MNQQEKRLPPNAEARTTKRGLLRNRNFVLLWIGETTSVLGNSMATVALPLIAVFELHASTFEVSLLFAAVWAPWLVLGFPAGAWVDRLPLRPLMIICDLVAAAVFAAVPVLHLAGLLTLPYLLVVALLAGSTSVFFTTAYHVIVPRLLPADMRIEGNARLQGSEEVAQIAGPGLAGPVARVFGPVMALLINSLTFLVSLVCLTLIRLEPAPRDEAARPGTMRGQIAEGLSFVGRDKYLRPLVLQCWLMNLMLAGFEAVQVIYLVRTLGAGPTLVGFLFAAGSVGGVLGAVLVRPIVGRLGTGRGLLLIQLVALPFGLLIPLAGPGWGLTLYALGSMVIIAGVVAGNVIMDTFRQAYCPPRLLGRVVASSTAVNYSALPLGALAGGLLGSVVDLRVTMWIAMGGLALTGLVLLTSPIRTVRNLPTRPPGSRGDPADRTLDRPEHS